MQVKKEWFASWFDSPYYHILYKNRDHSEANLFINNLLSSLQPKNKAKVLDLACGKGRHSFVMAQNGLDVLGADLSPQSIETAKSMESENLKFIVHDMRQAVEQNHFDYIFNLFTSFGYFSQFVDNLHTINSIHYSLKKEGILVLDFFNAVKTILNLKPTDQFTIDGVDFEIERKVSNGIIQKTIYINDKGDCKHFEERVQALVLEDFKAYMYNKFKILNLYGNYNLDPFDEQNSDRLIIVAVK